MTRVCVEWSRLETARLIARCREALSVSDTVHEFATEPYRTRLLALNGALTVVLVGIAATLSQDYQSRERDVEHALASLTAIAAALGVQEDGS